MFSACSLASLVLSVFLSQSSEFWICRCAPSCLRIISVYCYTWDYRHVPSYLGLQACTLTPGITGVDLAPGITGVDPHAKDYRCILLHLGLLACTLIPGIKCMSPHTWDCRQASSHLEFQVCTLSHLGLQGCTLTPGIAGVDPYTWLPWHFFFLLRSMSEILVQIMGPHLHLAAICIAREVLDLTF